LAVEGDFEASGKNWRKIPENGIMSGVICCYEHGVRFSRTVLKEVAALVW